jgi:type IV fimbrial biogenesis protein FimT
MQPTPNHRRPSGPKSVNTKKLPSAATKQQPALQPTLLISKTRPAKASLGEPSEAFSLLEILLVLTLIGILSLFAIPSWHRFYQNQRADQAIQTLAQAISTAQSLAVLRQQTLSLCPSHDGQTCQNRWRDHLLLFINPQSRCQPSTTNAIIDLIPFSLSSGSIQWRHFGGSPLLSFTPNGNLAEGNGTFAYCATDPYLTRAFSLNTLGRIRYLNQRDSHGYLLDPDGNPIDCLKNPSQLGRILKTRDRIMAG